MALTTFLLCAFLLASLSFNPSLVGWWSLQQYYHSDESRSQVVGYRTPRRNSLPVGPEPGMTTVNAARGSSKIMPQLSGLIMWYPTGLGRQYLSFPSRHGDSSAWGDTKNGILISCTGPPERTSKHSH
jgi:hypothetical protein